MRGFFKLLVFGPEDDGKAEGDGFEGVVDAFSEAASDVGYLTVAIDGGEHADVVYDHYSFVG